MEAQSVTFSGLLLAWLATCGDDEQRIMCRNVVVHKRHCVARFDVFKYLPDQD